MYPEQDYPDLPQMPQKQYRRPRLPQHCSHQICRQTPPRLTQQLPRNLYRHLCRWQWQFLNLHLRLHFLHQMY